MIRRAFPVLLLAAGLAACNQTAAGPNGVPAAATPDPGCETQVSEFQELLNRDVASGNLKRDVYSRAIADVRQAETACAAGRTVQSRSILISTKRNYGYPA